MNTITELHVNAAIHAVNANSDDALLDVLRDDLGLTGCKLSCGEGACGACTVLVADQAVRACVTAVGSVVGQPIRTIEGLAQNGQLHPLQQAFIDQDALQCGYCTPGMIMSALALLEHTPPPDDSAIMAALQGNICRCGAHQRIINAVRQAIHMLQSSKSGG